MALSRRDMLKIGGLGAVGVAGVSGLPFGGTLLARDAAALGAGDLPTPFAAAFWQPPVLRPVNWEYDEAGRLVRQYYEVSARETTAQILPGRGPTRMWGYDGLVPGPTIKVARGVETVVRVRNKLPDRHPLFGHPFDISTHLHGSASLPQYDGYADDLTHPGYFKDYYFPNWQPARTLWYHDHAVHHTALNAYSGLAAHYHVHDRVERVLLPQGEFDVPLTVTDALFGRDGQLRYDDESQSGLYGDVILVNGRPWPTMRVKRRVYRFRVLTASVSRSYRFRLNGGDPVHVVATDGGLVPRTQTVGQWRQGSAERYEVLVDFRRYHPGQRVVLENLSNDNNRDFDHTDKVMAFQVLDDTFGAGQVDRTDVTWDRIPDALVDSEVMALTAARARRSRHLEMGRTGGEWTINDATWSEIADSGHQKVFANPGLGDVEVWEIENRSGGWFHPTHIHLVDFRILDRDGRPPHPWELGPKDTVYVGEGETVRVVAKFGDEGRPRAQGRYMVHCHNLVHEDHDMMTQFAVGWRPGEPDENDPITAAPCQDDDLPVNVGFAPGRPEAPDVEVDGDVVELDWDPPEDDGDTPVTGYRVRGFAGARVVLDRVVRGRPGLTLRGLQPTRAYSFTVTAFNAAGAGPQSPPSVSVVPGVAGVDTVRPLRVGGRGPRPGARGVARGRSVRARFNRPVRGVSARTVRLQRAGGRRVPARVTYDPRSRRLVLDPRRRLAPNTRYTVRLTRGIRDRAGNGLAPTSWTFRTGPR